MTEGIAYPARIAPTPGGGIYVTDPPMKLFVEYDAAGALVGTHAIAEGAVGIAVHTDGRIFISRDDGKIGVYSTEFALLGTVNPAPLTLTGPNDLAFDSSASELYTVDSGSHRVLVFTESAPATWTLTRSWGMEGTGLGQFAAPQAIALNPTLGQVIVTDADNFRVQVFNTNGILLFKFGYRILFLPTSDTAWFARSEGVAVDACNNIYIVDALMGTVRVFSSIGRELSATFVPAVGYGTGAGQLRVPCDVAIDGAGKMYVASTNNGAVEVFNVACAVTASSSGPADEPRSSSKSAPINRREADGRTVIAPVAAVQPSMPDNPLEIVSAINSGEYCAEFDFNRNNVVDLADLQIAVDVFGAGTVEDFLNMADGVAAVSHPALLPPHILDLPNRCGRCHSMDGAPGGMLAAAGQENLCQSCHSAGKIAGPEWIGPGSDLNSHPWGVPTDDVNLDPQSELALHLDNGNVRCATCHEPHEGTPGGTCAGGACEGGPFHNSVCQNNDQCAPMVPYMREEIYRAGGDHLLAQATGQPAVMKRMTAMDPSLCGECHSDIVDQWDVAGHADLEAEPFVHYDWSLSNRSSCRQCHSGFGYIDFSKGVPAASQRGNLRVVDCLVCHSTHGTPQGETLLRIYDDVTLPSGQVITDVGPGATCVSCHNGRTQPPTQNTTTSLSTPHYLLGGVMLAGINGYAFGNTSLENSAHTAQVGCTDCHMAPGPTSGPGAWKVGGHTFNMKDRDSGFENVENACQGCHTGLATLNRTARGDYDGDGAVEGVQDEVSGLLASVLAQLQAKGAVQLAGYPYWNINAVPEADRILVKNGIWNWEYVDNSGDLGVHNTAYAVGLLQLTYEKLTEEVLANAYLRYVPTGQTASVQYTGTDACLTCHGAMAVTGTDYTSFVRTGHPYKLNEVKDGQMPTFPFSDITGALEMVTDNDAAPGDPKPGTDNTLGTPASYDDVSYVIGGFGWKARWVDLDGYIVTGTDTQFNLATGGMSAYNNNQVDKKYDCGLCHTTGWKDYTSATGDTRNLNRQNNLPGMEGTFYQPGIQCEACHGAGSFHVAAPSTSNITKVATPLTTADLTAPDMAYGKPRACSDCHTRDGEKLYPTYVPAGNRIKTSGGFIQHHEQYDEMRGINPDNVSAGATGPHAPLLCVACHNAHTTTVYMGVSGDSPGMNKHCTVCHNATGIGGKEYPPTNDMGGLVDCLDCHMPKMVKSAVSYPAVGTGPSTGDIRTHIFGIDLTTTTQFTGTGAFAYPWVTGQYACNHCHNGVNEFGLSFPDLVTTIHGGPPPGPDARRGGLLYDKWWVVNGAPAPTGNHPLYPPFGLKSGSTTYRCKECHGWEYLGKDGRYESGSHYTGIKGVLDAVTTMTEAQIFAIIKNPNGDGTGGTTVNGHDFATYGLSDGDINDLVAFIKNGGVIDPSPYINRAGSPGSYTYSFNGDSVAGASLYSGGVNPAVDCSMCHGPDGTAIAFGGVDFVGTLANENPQETFHKIRFGHAGSRMTSYYELGMTDAQAADVGAYCATLPQ